MLLSNVYLLFWGVLTQKKPKKTSRYTKIGKLALVFFGFLKFPNWHWFFFVFFLFFFGFFWHWFWPEFEIGNCFFLVFFGFFWFFWFFFGLSFGQHSILETGFWVFWFFFGFFWFFFGIFWFFWHLILGLECHPKKNQKIPKKNQKKPKKKNQKKPKKTKKTSRYTKIGKLAWFFFGFFLVFFGVSTPPPLFCIQNNSTNSDFCV